MKKLFLVAVAAIVSLAFFSCKKSSSNGGSSIPASSQWTIGSTTAKGDSSYIYSYGAGVGSDIGSFNSNTNDEIDITFQADPVTSGTYTVAAGSPSTATECSIDVENATGDYLSIGASGDKVVVTVSGGKATASFSNISLASFSTQSIVKLSGAVVNAH